MSEEPAFLWELWRQVQFLASWALSQADKLRERSSLLERKDERGAEHNE